MRVALVCICRDEARFLPEWLAHQVTLGFDRIFLFDHESTDGTAELIERLGRTHPMQRIPWASRPGCSPQLDAYRHAVAHLLQGFDWVAFLDCDEFPVLHQHASIRDLLAGFGPEIGAVGLNWLTFGSAGHVHGAAGRVTDAFRLGGPRHWSNNRHLKTIARVGGILDAGTHVCRLSAGAFVHPNGAPIEMPLRPGRSVLVEHSVAQLNHYQVKSRADFDAKMRRGRVGPVSDGPDRFRADPEAFFAALDRNEVRYDEIDRHAAAAEPLYRDMLRALAGSGGMR